MPKIFSSPCVVCGSNGKEMLLVGHIESCSGPGWGLYACLEPCARKYADRFYSPQWLREKLDARGL